MPFRAETTKGYVTALAAKYLLAQQAAGSSRAAYPVNLETRFRYNQSFESVNAMVPSVIMLMLMLIPAIMSTIGVVREKETGSIANFYSTPITKFEFLFGKQLPYIAVAMVSFVLLLMLAVFLFDVPVKGSLLMLVLGTLVYVGASTGFGQLVSTFTRTQVSAVFATIVIAIIPAVNFSGLLVPVSSLIWRRAVVRSWVFRRPGISRSALAPSRRHWASTIFGPTCWYLLFFSSSTSSPRSSS